MTHFVWKPLDVNYFRLYQVHQTFSKHTEWNKVYIVAAHSPTHARKLIEANHKDVMWIEEPMYEGLALDVYQPDYWKGAAVDPERAIHPVFGKDRDTGKWGWPPIPDDDAAAPQEGTR